MSTILESEKAPLHIGSVTLRARDIGTIADYYERMIGLDRIEALPDRVSLGSGGKSYLHIEAAAASAAREPDNAAGLFHTAFLLPDRAGLGRWFLRAYELGLPFEGASDHAVSEAFYLADPEGNGIEIYADRPRETWRRDADGGIHMTTQRMDVDAVVAAGRAGGNGDGRFPAESRIGHVHLKVGDAAAAEAFYTQALGLEVMARRAPQAVFMATGGYHHHVAVNTWMSRGAGRRQPGALGLAELRLEAADPATVQAIAKRMGGAAFDDPWGTRVVVG